MTSPALPGSLLEECRDKDCPKTNITPGRHTDTLRKMLGEGVHANYEPLYNRTYFLAYLCWYQATQIVLV